MNQDIKDKIVKANAPGIKLAMLKTAGLENIPESINQLLIHLISDMVEKGFSALEIHRILTLRLFRAAALTNPKMSITLSHDIKAKKYYIQAKTRWLMDDYTWKDYRVHIGSPEAFGMAGLTLAEVKTRLKNDKVLRDKIINISSQKMTFALMRRISITGIGINE